MKRYIAGFAVLLTLFFCFAFAACCKGNEFSVSAAQCEHGEVFVLQNKAVTGEKVVLSCMPDAGYKLDGYFVDGKRIEGNSFEMSEKDVEVSATFSIITYGIKYVVDGNESDVGNPKHYTVESGATLMPPPSKPEFEFAVWQYFCGESNWYLDEKSDYFVNGVAIGTTGELTLYAYYYNVAHAVTVDSEFETYVYPNCDEAMVGEEISLYNSGIDYRYELLYYTVNGVRIDGDTFVMPNGEALISAVIRPIDFSITYVMDGAENDSDNPDTHNAESDFVLKDAVKDGFNFIGWYCYEYGGFVYNLSDLYDCGDVTLWAEFEPITEEF
ncbi:MAG: InlB B-repeat-containing protein [Corallococcus sp.]|nr:InlB B-repeat-containing protein [Corallococcus sp.]MCM1359193.1 InlB B-repeat-containing protein [Corallococcus sp.]MCM1394583.1 InlB B-repeat-containing protein [Corallococcus sp.]